MNAKSVTKWDCGQCGKLAAGKAEAEECCRPKERVTAVGDIVEITRLDVVFKFDRSDNSVFISAGWLTAEEFDWLIRTRAAYFNNSL